MSEHVLTVLRAKRDQVVQQLDDTEKKLAKLRAAVANLDAAMAILSPDHPDYIVPQKRKTRYFAHNELSRLIRDTMRAAGRPMTAGEICASILAAKGYPESAHLAVTKTIVGRLNAFARQGSVTRLGKTRGAKWQLAV